MKYIMFILMISMSLTQCVGRAFAETKPKTPHKSEVKVTVSTGAKITCKIEATTLEELNILVPMVSSSLARQ